MVRGPLEWLRAFQAAVNSRNYEFGAELVDPSVLGFGTLAEMAIGRRALAETQWRRMWPHIIHFEFQTDSVLSWKLGEFSVICVLWKALNWKRGWFKARKRYWRKGRATIVLQAGKAIHTHFSLTP